MGKQVPYYNDTGKIQHIGSKTIFPGETREVDETYIPVKLQKSKKEEVPKSEAPNPNAKLLMILDGKVSDITAKLGDYSDEQLDLLKQAEENGNTRSTLIAAIDEEKMSRAQAAQEVEEFVKLIAEMDLAELQDQLETVKDDDGKVALINERIQALEAQGGN